MSLSTLQMRAFKALVLKPYSCFCVRVCLLFIYFICISSSLLLAIGYCLMCYLICLSWELKYDQHLIWNDCIYWNKQFHSKETVFLVRIFHLLWERNKLLQLINSREDRMWQNLESTARTMKFKKNFKERKRKKPFSSSKEKKN